MKSVTAYYLVLLYITVMVKPLLPLVSDWWGHEFNAIEHIAVVHAKYGSNHLLHELNKTSDEGDKSKSSLAVKTGNEVPFHLFTGVYKYNPLSQPGFKYQVFQLTTISFLSLPKNGPPPKSN